MAKFNYLDVVTHPILGEGVVLGVINDTKGDPFMLQVEWDDDPSEGYNMAENPCLDILQRSNLFNLLNIPLNAKNAIPRLFIINTQTYDICN